MRGLENKRWFFLNGELYKLIATNRAYNQLKAFNFAEQKPKMLILSEAKKYRKPAFDVSQVGQILNRSPRTIYYYIENGFFTPSGKSAMMGGAKNSKWWFSDDDVLELRGIIFENSLNAKAPIPLPSREETLAMVRTKKMLYVQEGDQFVPVWRAEAW